MSRLVRRAHALLLREFRQTSRTRGSLAIVLAGPALLLLLFGYTVSLDIERVPVAIVLEQSTQESRDLAGAFNNAKYFRPVLFQSRQAAERALTGGHVNGILLVAGDFARGVLGTDQTPVQVVVDGVDPRVSRTVISYTESAVATWLAQRVATGRPNFVTVKARIAFNAEMESRYFMVPGLIALLMTITGPLLTALLIVRERERGSVEAMLAVPLAPVEFILIKIAWFLVLGIGAIMAMIAFAVFLMDIPYRGALWPVVLSTALFMLCALGLGAVISAAAATQSAATQLILTTGYLPAYMLSGILFDLRNAPLPIQWASQLVPARHLAAILHTVMLAGDVWAVILPHVVALVLIALLLLGSATVLIRRRLS